MSAGEMALTEKSSFSYRQDNVQFLSIEEDLSIRIERISNHVAMARVFLVNAASVQQLIPPHITMTESEGAIVLLPYDNNFLISWVDTYTLYVNGQLHMVPNNQRQQSILGPAEAASGLV